MLQVVPSPRMLTPPRHHRLLLASAFAIIVFALFPLRAATSWYGRPFGGILVDPDGHVSGFGLPWWDGFRQGLRYPDRIVEVDGEPLAAPPGGGHRADVWDRRVAQAAQEGRSTVHVVVESHGKTRRLELGVSPLEPLAFWLQGCVTVGIALLYASGALLALAVSPRGRLARSFAKTTLFSALFLLTLFDFHTSRRLVPLFHLAFAMVPFSVAALALRLPDDVALLARHGWIVRLLDAVGLALGAAMIASQAAGGTTLALRDVCTALFAASLLFFAVTFLVRFQRARGDRRATLRALLVGMVPAHVVLGIALLISALSLGSTTLATSAFLVVPALALTPLATVYALIRHDLWGSRALLSRVLVRGVIVAVTCACAVALGTLLAMVSGVPWGGALLAAGAAGIAAGIVVAPALRFSDEALFPSRAVYKPSIEQLSEELTLITVPDEVGRAVERTVRRWLPCDRVEFCPLEGAARSPSVRPAERGDERSGIRSVLPLPGRPSEPTPPAAPASEAAPAEELALDVLFRGIPLAVLRVGKKRGGALFTSEDLDLLRTIANQAALALAHAYSYAELEERRRQQAAAWRGEREVLVETVAAEIAHEVRYPINYFRSIFRREQGPIHLDAEDVDIGCDEVERLERLVSGLRRVVSRRLERRRVSVEDLIVKVERLLRDQLGARTLQVDVAGVAFVRCDFDQVTQVLVNLLSNALDAAGEDGRVGVAWSAPAETRDAGDVGGVLTVWDTGPGFEGDPARVFAPWYTTKPRGTGLGLAITHRIVRAHGWTIEPERRDGRTLFVIEIPASDIALPQGDRGMEVA